jgi:hypothetical protein
MSFLLAAIAWLGNSIVQLRGSSLLPQGELLPKWVNGPLQLSICVVAFLVLAGEVTYHTGYVTEPVPTAVSGRRVRDLYQTGRWLVMAAQELAFPVLQPFNAVVIGELRRAADK